MMVGGLEYRTGLNFIGNTISENNSAVNDGGGIGALNNTLNTAFRIN